MRIFEGGGCLLRALFLLPLGALLRLFRDIWRLEFKSLVKLR
jgi:hypothetical protein